MSIRYKTKGMNHLDSCPLFYMKSVIIRIYNLRQHESYRCGQKRHQHPIR